jgi:NAD(P)-dependent dehydrogenase (short-subunit alcohol dehydrogenase family)
MTDHHPAQGLTEPLFDLSGKVALITGAGQGLGVAAAEALALHGAAVAVNDLFPERAAATVDRIRSIGGRAMAAPFDVRDRDAVSAAIDGVESELGAIDIVVHNAGINADGFPVRKFRDMEPELWDAWLGVNLWGMCNLVHRTLGHMEQAGWGRYVFVSSEAGRTGIGLGVSMYGAAKAATVQFCRHLSQEVARNGVTVNCLALGQMSAAVQDIKPRAGSPVGRMGVPSDLAAGVVYLVSREASFVTGQTLGVNGGGVTS